MLLNEFLKEHRKVETLEGAVTSLVATVKEQAAQIQKVSAQLKRANLRRMWSTTISSDNLSQAGWSWGCILAVDRQGQTIWIADAHRGDNQRFIVSADAQL